MVQATVREGISPARVEAGITAQVGELAAGRIEPVDLERSKNQILARHALESESVTDVAHQLGFFETIGSHRIWLELPRRVAAVTAEAVARAAAARLDATHRTVGILEPADATAAVPAPAS
jgi:predicted Zn-dependent peptidase